ncbi:MAG: PspC domain-containing protein [Anaerolineae bacterium]|nr:PspC domain-containing protein [Anaerolineae bacterium]MCA9911365.1 PspC domain-containing protein [Anaerolineae bacterium]
MKKRLVRSKTDRQISGVCAGLAQYFELDPTVVRLIFVVATLLGGPGLIIYIVLAIVMPEEGKDSVIEKSKNDDIA